MAAFTDSSQHSQRWGGLLLVIIAVIGASSAAWAVNTIESSTMVFEGNLTDDGDGTYSGTIPFVNETLKSLGDEVEGFSIYAENGAVAMYFNGSTYVHGTIVDHDAYTTAGGWGSWYDPDCADWVNYQIRLDGDEWALEYNKDVGTGDNTTGPRAAPLSGGIDWDTMYVTETGTGAYYEGSGFTPKNESFATSNPWVNGTVGHWDMDWVWGSENIPLEYPGFEMDISYVSGDTYTVTLTPAPVPDVNEVYEPEYSASDLPSITFDLVGGVAAELVGDAGVIAQVAVLAITVAVAGYLITVW